RTPVAVAAYASCLFVAKRYDEAARTLAPLTADQLRTITKVDKTSAIKIFLIEGRVESAYTILCDPDYAPPWGAEYGPLGRLVEVADFVRTGFPTQDLDLASIGAFARSVRGRVTDADWKGATEQLRKLGVTSGD